VLLLTKSTLHSADCLIAAAEALSSGKTLIPVLLTGRGYDFAANQRLLEDLRGGLDWDELALLQEQLQDVPSGSVLADRGVDSLQAALAAALPSIIAVQWHPEGGDNQRTAAVEDIFRRLQTATIHTVKFCAYPCYRRRLGPA